MKRLLLALPLAFALASCGAPGGPGGFPPLPTTINSSQIQSSISTAIQNGCQFEATAATLANLAAALANAFIPGVSSIEGMVESAANQVCAVISPLKTSRRGAVAPVVNIGGRKVTIHGRWLR